MANDLINSWQTFRDDKNRVISNGGLRIYENRTTTLGTAFSDDELQTAQSVDPYRLDAQGRVRADLKWQGKRTVRIYNARNELIRTLNDVVTMVDTSVFAINVASVAAMVANTALEVGDIVETQSYNAGQNEGGARYEVVAAATGTADGYRFIDLATHQARLLDQELNRNPYVAGAVGDGNADDTAPVNAILAVGGDLNLPDGIFQVDALALSANARIYGSGTLLHSAFTTTNMLNLTGTDLVVLFEGITIDGNKDNQIAEAATASINSTLTSTSGNVSLVSFSGVTFKDGTEHDVRADGSDNGFPVLFGFNNCTFLDGLEATATPYLPACIHVSDGVSLLVDDCYFDKVVAPTAVGGRVGIRTSGSAALSNPGDLTVNNSTFNEMGANTSDVGLYGAINAQDINRIQITDNRFIDPQTAGILWGAECDVVKIAENSIDSLTGTNVLGGICATVTSRAAGGSNWTIESNVLVDVAGIGITLDGASAGVDAAAVAINGNVIDSPTSQAILVENLNGLAIGENVVNMASLDAVNGIEVDADGLSGVFDLVNNTVLNVGSSTGVAVLANVTSSGAIYNISGNSIEGCVDGLTIAGATTAFIKDNAMAEVSGDLITLSSLTNAYVDGNSYTGTDPTTWLDNDGSITNLVVGHNLWEDMDASVVSVASASALPITAHYHLLTGTTAVNTLAMGADVKGWRVTIQGPAASSVTFNDGASLNLGSATRVLSATDTLTLMNAGSNVWNEVAFSNN